MDNDLKMLYQVQQGNIIHIVGRLLQPFCSHAVYRVRVTDLHSVGHGCFVIHGSLVDFKDSPVQSYALHGKLLFRWEDPMLQTTKLSREDIRRVLCDQGLAVRFRAYNNENAVYVEVMAADKHTRSLGSLATVERLTEEDLASLARTKLGLDCQEEAEKVEVTV